MLPLPISTLFPQLPERSMATFGIAFAAGVGLIFMLGLAGLFPVALVLAAALLPLLLLLYLYDVDVYEDAPVTVVGATMVFGAIAGALTGLALEASAPSGAAFLAEDLGTRSLVRGVLAPLAGFALTLGGALVLLRDRRFDDVLDGTTFGAACAVAFVSAQVLVQSQDVLAAGLQPAGDRWAWAVRLLELGVALPMLAAGAVGSVSGAVWLRHRAPVRRRDALGVLGRPAAAVPLGALMLVAAGMGQLVLPWKLSSAWICLLALTALVWLRHVIHVGLLEESAEAEIESSIACTNCGSPTPLHTFCADCGVSLHALPKRAAG
jgi:hypothetical protein